MNIHKHTFAKEQALKLIAMHGKGLLGGEVMPEDAMPTSILRGSREQFLFLTLPMALNYQRNSYKLWEAAAAMWLSEDGHQMFLPECVGQLSTEELKHTLIKYKVALQPNKHTEIWQKISACLEGIKSQISKTVTVILGTYPDKTELYERVGFIEMRKDHDGGSFMMKTLEVDL